MNGEGGIGSAEEDLSYLRGDFVTGIDFGSAPGGYFPDISLGFIPALPQTFFELPPIRSGPPGSSSSPGDSATAGDEAVSPIVVDPEQGTQTTVFEDAPGGIYETNRAPTDWDAVYDAYVILNPEEPEVPFEGIIDWGVDILSGVAGGILDPAGIGQAIQTAYAPSWLTGAPTGTTVTGVPSLGQQTSLATGAVMQNGACPPTGPKYGKICLATGVITPLRRRRRRRLLTSSDIKDLSALKSIVGGAALQGAVVQAVRR